MFVGLSELEESFFADRLNLFVALGPVAKITHTTAAFVGIADTFYDVIADAADLFNIYNVLSLNWLTDAATDIFCVNVPEFCEFLMGFFTNSKTSLDDDDRFAVYFGHEPNGGTVRSLLHYS